MNKTILTLAAVLLASGTAFASDRFGDAAPTLGNTNAAGAIATTASEPVLRSGDAAPAPVVVNAPKAGSFASSAAISATGTYVGTSPRVLYGSN